MDPYPLEQPDLSTDPRMRVRLMERGFHLQYTPTDHTPPQPPIKVLSLQPCEHAWLCKLIHSIPWEAQRDTPLEAMLQANNFARSDFDKVFFCVTCNRGLYKNEDPSIWLISQSRYISTQRIDVRKNFPSQKSPSYYSREHQALNPPHTRQSLLEVVNCGGGYHLQAQSLTALQVPVKDVLSHVLSNPYTNGNLPYRCIYIHPNRGKMNVVANCNQVFNCASPSCEKVLSWTAGDSHHKLYGQMPQFCSLSCKLQTYARTPSGDGVTYDRPALSYDSNPGPEFFPTTTINRIGTTSTHGPDFQDRKNDWRTD